jgi:hypothetical protein
VRRKRGLTEAREVFRVNFDLPGPYFPEPDINVVIGFSQPVEIDVFKDQPVVTRKSPSAGAWQMGFRADTRMARGKPRLEWGDVSVARHVPLLRVPIPGGAEALCLRALFVGYVQIEAPVEVAPVFTTVFLLDCDGRHWLSFGGSALFSPQVLAGGA